MLRFLAFLHKPRWIRAAILPQTIAALLIALLSLPVTAPGQWERLPLFAGHAEQLIQNKFKPNEIFAVVARGGIYKSEDYGETWRTLVTDIARLRWDEIFRFEVSAAGRHYAVVRSFDSEVGIWCSSDDGASWTVDRSLSVDLHWPVTLEAHQDSTMMIFTRPNTFCIQSKDDFARIDTIRFDQMGPCIWTVLFHPDTSRILFIDNDVDLNATHIERSSDRGLTWSSVLSDVPHYSRIVDLKKSQAESSNHLGLWLEYGRYQPDALLCDYYESSDNGVTWSHADKACVVRYIEYGDSYTQAWYDICGINLLSTCNTLFRSTDSNRTVMPVGGISIWSMLPVKQTLLASTTMDGLQASTNQGMTWKPTRSSQPFAGYFSIEYAAANTDTMFAILCDEPSSNPRGYHKHFIDEVVQSFDGGMSWSTAVRDTILLFLRASDAPQARFYAVSNEKVLVRGTLSTACIDTLYASTGTIIQYELSEACTNDMFVVERHDEKLSVSCSTDGGGSWFKSFAAPIFTEKIEVIPSREERGTYLVICYTDESVPDWWGMGLWLVRQYGQSQTRVLSTFDRLIKQYILFGNNILYRKGSTQFSYDYGRTWVSLEAGLDSADVSMIHSYHGQSDFTYQSRLYIPCGSKWFCFMDSVWQTVRDVSGREVSRTPPTVPTSIGYSLSTSVARVGEYIYSGNAYDGLYRIKVSDVTPVEPLLPEVSRILLECYPNPFSASTVIKYSVPRAGRVTLRVYSLLGREVARLVNEEQSAGVHSAVFEAGAGDTTGMYFYILTTQDGTLTGRMSLVR